MIRWLILTVLLNMTHAARILGFYPIPSISHQAVYQPIWKELSLRGHQVTVITPNPLNDSKLANLTEIDIGFLYRYGNDEESKVERELTHWDKAQLYGELAKPLFEVIFRHPLVLQLLNNPAAEFDLVMVESILPHGVAFGYKYRCPVIGMSSLNLLETTHHAIGNPTHPVLFPDIFTTFGDHLTFWEKIEAVLYSIWWKYMYYIKWMPHFDREMRRYCGEDMPYLADLEGNMSMVFINTNPILHGPRPYSQAVVELGGMMHIHPKKPLPPVSST